MSFGDKKTPDSGSIFGRIGDFIGRRRPWYKLPTLLAIPPLVQIRNDLRKYNLHDTEDPPLAGRDPNEPLDPAVVGARTVDGTYNDLNYPKMGSAGCPFGRNFPLNKVIPDDANLLVPNPRDVSLTLMTRNEFQPVPFLNLLAASWIQFMVHDWFVHESSDDIIEIPLKDGDPWHENPMRVAKTKPHAGTPKPGKPPVFDNRNSHWWDGSQIYGCETESCGKLRTGVDGKLKIGTSGRLLTDPETGLELTGFTDNSWVGLSMLHSLFTLEHNAVCDMLKGKYPNWDDERLHGKARLITSALLAKIHTVDWTPAILPHPTTQLALRTNWYGLAGEDLQDVLEFLDESEYLGGIVGSSADHHGAPYSLTEEFVAVYRMHPLMPDQFTMRSVATNETIGTYELPALAGKAGVAVLESFSMADLFYSFGRMHPGQIRLHNYPKHLQALIRDDGTRLDLAAVEILRDRERGVPRYNEFRRLLRKDPVTSFEELTDNPQWAEEMRRVYDNDIEKVDLMVGLLAEPLPEGFGFSETAFRIFVLMASRRLKSDRFFTDDYRPEIYTQEGLDWVRHNSMATVLRRHYPSLGAALDGLENPFQPWKIAADAGSRGATA